MVGALVMAGGKGSRLHPYSAVLPKPLMPLGDRPVLELLLRQLRAAGVEEVILAVNHLRHLIEAYFDDGRRLGLKIGYSVEERPLGTAGPIGQVLERLDDDFIVTNGDLLTTLDIRTLLRAHRERGADATVGAFRRDLRSEFGVLEVDDEMRLTGMQEKPVYVQLVSMGIYVLRRDAVRPFLEGRSVLDMPDLLRSMQAAGRRVFCHRQDCFWLDIGRPEDFAQAQALVEEDPDRFERFYAAVPA